MSRQMPYPNFLRTALAGAATLSLFAAAGEVRADGYRVGASVRVGPDGTYVRPAHRVYRPVRARRLVVQGSLWGGDLFVGFAEPPPPPPPPCPESCEPPAPPAYHQPYQHQVATRAPAPRRWPRLALGGFVGGIDVENREAGEAYGLVGRYHFGRHLALEAELSRDEIEQDVRVDDRMGGALLLNLMPQKRLNPYLLVGGGVMFTDVADGAYESRAGYAEAGIGLELKLGRRLSVTLEGRSGARRSAGGAEPAETPLRYIAPPADRQEAYTRGRLGALLYF